MGNLERCPKCGHAEHVKRNTHLAGICIGCPCDYKGQTAESVRDDNDGMNLATAIAAAEVIESVFDSGSSSVADSSSSSSDFGGFDGGSSGGGGTSSDW